MALFTYIFERDQVGWRNVSDPEVKEALDEASTFDKSLMISVYRYKQKKGLFSSEVVEHFTVYHEVFFKNGNSAMEARQQMSASGSKEKCIAYLHGIINGARALLRKEENNLSEDEIFNLSGEELDAVLRKQGYDPRKLEDDAKNLLNRLIKKAEGESNPDLP